MPNSDGRHERFHSPSGCAVPAHAFQHEHPRVLNLQGQRDDKLERNIDRGNLPVRLPLLGSEKSPAPLLLFSIRTARRGLFPASGR